MLESRRRRGQNSFDQVTCQACGVAVDISTRPGQRKKRSDTKYCDDCSRLKNLRVVNVAVTVEQARSLGLRCGICSLPVDLSLRKPDLLAPSIDHIVPKALGGTDDLSNLQMAHWGCNQRKHLRVDSGDHGRSKRQLFYNNRRWRNLSHEIRAAEPDCRLCGTPAVCVDHIQGIHEGGDPWDRSNLQPLCRRCHNRKSQDEYRARWSA